MGFLDHKGESEFPFAKEEVFKAMATAIPNIKGMRIENADRLQGRIVVKAQVSLMSWGENIPILLSEISENRTKVSITSTPKTGVLFGGAFDLGKNRKNIEKILSATSSYLSKSNQKTNCLSEPNQRTSNHHPADDIEYTQLDKKWYDNIFVTHLLLIIFFPVGLYALWKSRTLATWWKVTASIIIALFINGIINSSDGESPINDNSVTATSNTPKIELTQAQRDSVEVMKKERQEEERKRLIDERELRTIKAPNLVAGYVTNEVAADKQYKGKEFFVEGIIDDIGKDILGKIYVTLKSEEVLRSVQCLIDDEDAVSVLRKGHRITVYGKCSGLMMNVIMKDCKLVKNKEDL